MKEFIVNVVFESEQESFLQGELQAVKSALLYADKVSIASGSLTCGLSLHKTFGADALSRLSAPEGAFTEARRKIAQIEDEILSASVGPKTIEISKRDASLEILHSLEHFASKADEKYLGRINEFNSLINKGLVIYSGMYYDLNQVVDSSLVVKDYLSSISSGLNSPSTFNMFNQDLCEFLQNLHQLLGLSNPQIRDLKYTRFMDYLLADLPGIQEAKVDEIVDIRKTLARPRVNFRTAVFDFSDQIASAPWDKDFEVECRHLYHQKVAPAISDIDQTLKDNKVIKKMVPSGSKVTGIIGAVMSGNVPGIIGNLLECIINGFSSNKRKLAKENSFYFLYEADKRLGKNR